MNARSAAVPHKSDQQCPPVTDQPIEFFCLDIGKHTAAILIINQKTILQMTDNLIQLFNLSDNKISISLYILNANWLCIRTAVKMFTCQRTDDFLLPVKNRADCMTDDNAPVIYNSDEAPTGPPCSSARYTAGSSAFFSISPTIFLL